MGLHTVLNSDISFLIEVAIEATRARFLFPGNWGMLAALSEEAGEVAKAFLDQHRGKETPEGLVRECIQTAAMALRCANEGDASFFYRPRNSFSDEAHDLSVIMSIVLATTAERREQDLQWGGPTHDDRHLPSDWCDYILHQASACSFEQNLGSNRTTFEERMIKVIALATAAIESSRRINEKSANTRNTGI